MIKTLSLCALTYWSVVFSNNIVKDILMWEITCHKLPRVTYWKWRQLKFLMVGKFVTSHMPKLQMELNISHLIVHNIIHNFYIVFVWYEIHWTHIKVHMSTSCEHPSAMALCVQCFKGFYKVHLSLKTFKCNWRSRYMFECNEEESWLNFEFIIVMYVIWYGYHTYLPH